MVQITGITFLAFLYCFEANRQERDVSSLLETYQFNKYLLSSAPKPFQIVFPKQVRKRGLDGISTKERQISHHGTYEHVQQVTFQIVIDRKKHKLKLDRNDGLLSAGIKVKHFEDDRRQVITQTVEHCYYHGTIKRDDWSAAAVSTCNGISGIIQISNETYVIQPLEGGSEGMDHPHIVYKATSSKTEKCGNDHGKWLPFHELHKGEFLRKLKFLNAQRSRRDTPEELTDKFLKLALVLDNSMYWSLNRSISQMSQYAIQLANIVDLYYKELNIRMALTYVELWNRKNRINVSEKLRETLENFLKYKQKHLRDTDHHAAHLLTSIDFEDETVGMAIPDAVCTGRASGISKMPNFIEPQQGATILSHMMGHNLGIKHDEDSGCECSDEFGCMMSTEVLATPEKHSRMFSSCSVADWDVSLNLGIAACLTENPQPTFPQVCGNRHLERGEECDCGSPEDCAQTDPCCDPSTCLLKYWAQCRSGACCHNCTYLSQNYLCRQASTDCDVPEFCTGQSGQCPSNNYAKDGHPCSNNTGYCIGGICPTLDKQCQNIWGKDAISADVQCFERFNPTGNFNGHCGKDDKTGSFAKCLPDNIQCGLLHCAGGNKVPFYGPDKDSSKTTVFSNGQEYECKIVHGPSTMALPQMGLVQDGTKCGEGLMCMNTNCVPVTTLPTLNCPGTKDGVICSGHGVCTKDDKCFCDAGWGTANCSVKLNLTRIIMSVDSATDPTTTTTTTEPVRVIPIDVSKTTQPPSSMETESSAVVQVTDEFINTKWMWIILAAVVGGLTLLLGLSFLCYRRRSPGKFGKDKKKKKLKHLEEGEDDSSNKLIKFGSLPSYKKDKKKKKGKKGKKGGKSTDDSDMELPPPPVIICDPNSAKPEKGILKSPFNAIKYANDRRSSESNTVTSEYGDRESIDPYDEIDDDTEAGEIQDILSGTQDEHENNLDKLDSLVESSSFELMLPPPFGNMDLLNRSPSPPRRFNGYDLPFSNLPQRPILWKSSSNSPPRPKALKMKNLGEIFQHIDKHTIDLSPSPDDPPVQISPSTSEDVRSTSTDDRQYPGGYLDLQSPNSLTSGSTCTALRPLLGSQWSKYILPSQKNNLENGNQFSYDIDSPLPHINIPPPMHPLSIRSIFNYGQKGLNRDNNDTPLGSMNGECSSNNGTANSRNGYEKSSGYGSEHDPERFSLEDMSRNQSRSGSASPPNFSAVIRTGPHQIKLVPGNKIRETQTGPYSGENVYQKILDDVPRIDAGCYERSPLSTLSSNMNSVTSTLETLKNSVPEYSSSEFTSNTNTLVNSENNTLEKTNSDGSDKEGLRNEHSATSTLEMLKRAIPELADGPLPNPKPLCDIDQETGSAPCIDRSLEEISQLDNQKNGKKHRNSLTKRPVSLSVFKKQNSSERESDDDPFLGKRYSAIDPVPVEICEC